MSRLLAVAVGFIGLASTVVANSASCDEDGCKGVSSSLLQSGVVRHKEIINAMTSTTASNECRPGQDIKHGTFRKVSGSGAAAATDEECSQRCSDTPGCTAWIRPTADAGGSNCWMHRGSVQWEADHQRNGGSPGCQAFVGCYKDDGNRMFNRGPKKYGYNADTCRSACSEIEDTHFALQNGGWCVCGTDLDFYKSGSYSKRPDAECGHPQDKYAGVRGGGGWRNAVYRFNEAAVTPSVTYEFELTYSDRGTGAKRDLRVWRPKVGPGEYRIFYIPAWGSITGSTMNVKEKSGEALKPPLYFTQVWNDKATGGKRDGSFWQPKAPDGYACLSDVAVFRGNEGSPGLTKQASDIDPYFRCVKKELVEETLTDVFIWSSYGTGGWYTGAAYTMSKTPGLAVGGHGTRRDGSGHYNYPHWANGFYKLKGWTLDGDISRTIGNA